MKVFEIAIGNSNRDRGELGPRNPEIIRNYLKVRQESCQEKMGITYESNEIATRQSGWAERAIRDRAAGS